MNKLEFLGLPIENQIQVWNEFSRENYWQLEIYDNDDTFFDMFFLTSPTEAVRVTHYGNYDYLDQYCYFDGNGNISSFTFIDDFHDIIDIDEMLKYYESFKK